MYVINGTPLNDTVGVGGREEAGIEECNSSDPFVN